MIAYILSKVITIFYAMLYPAYCSYKAVKTKDVKEYVHWMMYWIVFSIFSVLEVFADTFIGLWFPFYYELKILFIIWLLSPTTRGGSTVYRRFIHPFFTRHESEIDSYIAEFKLRTSSLLVQWSSKAFSYLTDVITTAVFRGGVGDFRFSKQVSRTYSYENFDQPDLNRNSSFSHMEVERRAEVVSDLDSSFEESTAVKHRNPRSPPSEAPRYSAMEDHLLGRLGEMSKPFSMMDLTDQSQAIAKPRTSSRKKKEDNMYGTLPRAKRTRKAPK